MPQDATGADSTVAGPTGAAGATGATGPTGAAGLTAAAPNRLVSASGPVSLTDYTVFCNVTGAANVALTLPTAVGNAGRIFMIRRVGAGAGDCTITPVAGGGILNTGFLEPRATTFMSDGTNWYPVGQAYQ